MGAEHMERPLRSFGRRRTKRLQGKRKETLESRLPDVVIEPGEAQLDVATLFGASVKALWLEIGFGGGEHVSALASRHPDVGFIGCEPFMDGVSKLLTSMETLGLNNIRIYPDDVRGLLTRLPTASLEKVFILFPDPWPKQRHHKRRLVNAFLLDVLARVLRPGGQVLLATDHADYAQWMLEHMLADRRYAWTARGPEDFTQAPTEWVVTRYQEKAAAEGRQPVFFTFVRQDNVA